MLKKSDKSEKKIKTSKLRSNKIASPKLITYGVGVYFPGQDVLTFVVTAHGYALFKEWTHFFRINDLGNKEEIASFTHVAWIAIKDNPISTPVDAELPANFGQLL